jgi:hypothetical protein
MDIRTELVFGIILGTRKSTYDGNYLPAYSFSSKTFFPTQSHGTIDFVLVGIR